MRKVLWFLLSFVALGASVSAQVTGPSYVFVDGTTARAAEVNTNFTDIYAAALNRTAGVMTGTLTSQSLIPSASNTYDWGSASFPYRTGYLNTSAVLVQTTGNYTLTWANPAAARAISIADPGGTDVFTFNAATQTLTNKTITAPVFSGTSSGTYTLGGTATWAGVAIGPTVGGTNQTTWTTGDLLYSSSANTLAKRAIGTTGQVLMVAGGVPTWATGSPMTLLCQMEGTDATAAATNVATCAISGLTVKDHLRVVVRHSSITQQTDTPVLYNSTDSVNVLTNLTASTLLLNTAASASVDIMADPSATTRVVAQGMISNGTVITGGDTTGTVRTTLAAFTTAWTGSWTLALRTGTTGVNAGGTYYFRMSVYKVAGQ